MSSEYSEWGNISYFCIQMVSWMIFVQWQEALPSCINTRSCRVSHSVRFSSCCRQRSSLTVSLGFSSFQYTIPFWSHQTQCISFFPNRFGRAVNVEAPPVGGLSFSKYTHFSVIIRFRKLLLSCRKSQVSNLLFNLNQSVPYMQFSVVKIHIETCQ